MKWLLEPPICWLPAMLGAALCFDVAFAQDNPTTLSDVDVNMRALEPATASAKPHLPLPLVTPPQPTKLPLEIAAPTRDEDVLPPPVSAFGVPGQPPEPATTTVPQPLPEAPAAPAPQSALQSWIQTAQSSDGNMAAPETIEEVPITPPDSEAAIQETPTETPAVEEEIPPSGETTEQPSETTPEQPEEVAPEEAAPTEAEEPVEEPEPDPNAPAAEIAEGGVRIVYPAEEKGVPTEAYPILDELAGRMTGDESLRLEIDCYAAGDKETEGKARRNSLVRCLAVRQYLIEKDIRSTRMDIRALGFRSSGQPVDRVDILPAPEGQ